MLTRLPSRGCIVLLLLLPLLRDRAPLSAKDKLSAFLRFDYVRLDKWVTSHIFERLADPSRLEQPGPGTYKSGIAYDDQ